MLTLNNRISELTALAAAEGLRLPYPAPLIARLEDTGAVVDLVTGAILIGEADTPYGWTLTADGATLAHRLFSESGAHR
jgi:hypothetical protein